MHTGYIYANGLSEGYVGVATACSSVAGILGALIYTQLHRCLGLERTGLVSFTFQISMLCFCVLSIWLPGSPFQPEAIVEQFTSGGSQHDATVSVQSNVSAAEAVTAYDVIVVNATAVVDAEHIQHSSSAVTPSIIVFVSAIVVSRMGE